MKVLFLDIDGVLNSNFWNEGHQREINNRVLIDFSKVELLARIVEGTGAAVVLHSGWRFWFDEKLRPIREESQNLLSMLQSVGVTLFDVTPDYTTDEIRENKTFGLVKPQEILAWIKGHPEVDKWIVLEDLDLNNQEIAKHQIKTDQTVGLTEMDVKAAIKALS